MLGAPLRGRSRAVGREVGAALVALEEQPEAAERELADPREMLGVDVERLLDEAQRGGGQSEDVVGPAADLARASAAGTTALTIPQRSAVSASYCRHSIQTSRARFSPPVQNAWSPAPVRHTTPTSGLAHARVKQAMSSSIVRSRNALSRSGRSMTIQASPSSTS